MGGRKRRRNRRQGIGPTFCCGWAPYVVEPPVLHPIFGHFIRPYTVGTEAESVYCKYAVSLVI